MVFSTEFFLGPYEKRALVAATTSAAAEAASFATRSASLMQSATWSSSESLWFPQISQLGRSGELLKVQM